jgi:hypothetical protein
MTNVWKILFGIAVGLAITGWLFWGVQGCTNKKVVQSLNDSLKACQNAPVRSDTAHDTIYIKGETVTKPVPVKVVVHDTIIKRINEAWYDSTFSDNGIRFRWKSKIWGSMDYISFSDFVIPKETITITKTVVKDTCVKIKQPLFRWGPYVGMPLNSFTKLSGVEVGAQVVVKDQLTVSAGLLITNGAYGNITVGWLFKK